MDYYGLTYEQAVEFAMEMNYHGVNDSEALLRVRAWTERNTQKENPS
jgi:hypothetical protein